MDRNRLQTIQRLATDADAARATPMQDAADGALAGAEVVAALEHLIESDPGAALVLAGQLSGFWQDAGRVEQGRTLTQRALDAGAVDGGAGSVSTPAAARATLVAADLAFRQGDQEAATRNARTAIELAAAAGDDRTAGLAWIDLARVAYREGDAAGIETASLTAGNAAPDDPLVARGVLHMLAWAAHTAGDLGEARRRFEASLALRRAQGGALGIASELANLGDLAMDAGDRDSAVRWFSEALTAARDLDSAYFLVNTLPSIAALAVADDPELAARLFGAADAASSRSGLLPDPGADRPEARAALRDSMDAGRFEELLDEGSELTTQAVAALANRVAGTNRVAGAGAQSTWRRRAVETVVVGAGQAGLVMSRLLADAGREHVVLERRTSLGGGWQDRWDAFRLVSPNWTVSVPGLDYQGAEPDGFMPRDEIIDHGRRYAATIAAPVELETDVTRLLALDDGPARFRLTTSRGTIDARNVVVAGGPFQTPYVPAAASGFGPSIRQVHAHHYRRPEDLPPGRILLSGYRPALDWIELPVLDELGLPRGSGGVTDVEGLTFIGLPWMVDMGSANLVGLVRDATALAARW